MALNSLVITMAFHTYLAHVVAKAKENNPSMLNGNGAKVFHRMDEKQDKKENLKVAAKLNNWAKVVFAIVIVLFNVIFWTVAFREYVKPSREYLL